MKNFKLNLKKKLNRKGFTLAELLVVVAILGILVAISVPLFSSRMEAAKTSTDQANVRAAKAAAAAVLLSDQETKTMYYDAENGKLVEAKPTAGYGKSIKADESGAKGTPNGNILKVIITAATADSGNTAGQDGTIELEWVAAGSTSG